MSNSSIRDTFFEECEELLEALVEGLAAMEENASDMEVVNAVFRAVHSIKGGAGAFCLDDLVHFAHVFETTLDEMRTGRLDSSEKVVKIMLRSADALADLVTAARDGGTADAERNAGLIDELKGLVALAKGEEPPAPSAPTCCWSIPPGGCRTRRT